MARGWAQTRVLVYTARTLNAEGQSRVTLSRRSEHLRAACLATAGGKGPEIRPKPRQVARTLECHMGCSCGAS